MSLGPLRRLIAVKVHTLLKDPPYKQWCMNERLSGGSCDYEQEARLFRERLLDGTAFKDLEKSPERSEVERLAKIADSIAAGFDKWLLGLAQQARARSTVLANIFDPGLRVNLASSGESTSVNTLRSKAVRLAEQVNKLLKGLADCSEEAVKGIADIHTLSYLVLYVALEPYHYRVGLPPSVADARVSTHTIYDHLYASATAANIIALGEGREPQGYLVLVDVPGVQEFIAGARKIGDAWAASWLLTQLVWRLVEPIVFMLGPDVLVTPTARLNPLFYASLLKLLEKAGKAANERGYDSCARALQEVRSKLEELLTWFIHTVAGTASAGKRSELEMVSHQALAPATATLILPRLRLTTSNGIVLDFTSKDAIVETVLKLYERAWRSIVEDVLNGLRNECRKKLGEGEDSAWAVPCLMYAWLKHVEESAATPPVGPRILVIDLAKAYRAVKACLEGNAELCSSKLKELGLDGQLDAEAARRFVDELSSKYGGGVGPDTVAYTFFLHVAFKAVRRSASETIPIPYTPWVIDGRRIRPAFKAVNVDTINWVPCSLCGSEPAVLRLRKRVERINGVREDYVAEDLLKAVMRATEILRRERELSQAADRLCEKITKDLDQVKQALRPFMRPGEAMGPHCLLKRAVYLIFGLRRGRIRSTDDIALAIYVDQLLRNLFKWHETIADMYKILVEECKKLVNNEEGCRKAVEYVVLSEPREIELAADSLGLTLEGFRKTWSQIVETVLKRVYEGKSDELARIVVKAIARAYGCADLELDNDVVDTVRRKLGTVTRRLAELRTAFLIVRGDADNIGSLHEGVLEGLSCSEYYRRVLEAVEPLSDVDREKLEEGFSMACKLLSILDPEATVAISLSYKSAISVSLMATAVRDYYLAAELGGSLAFSSGDDFLALLPPEALALALGFRLTYAGASVAEILQRRGGRVTANYFHRIGDIPFASAIPWGRSLSIRVVELMDVLAFEAAETAALLEHPTRTRTAKKASWNLGDITWRKDSVIISASRARGWTMLPLTLRGSSQRELMADRLMEFTCRLASMYTLGLISRNLPEDFRTAAQRGEVSDSTLAGVAGRMLLYAMSRNAAIRGAVSMLLKDTGLGRLLDEVRDGSGTPLALHLADLAKVVRLIA